MHNYKWYFKNPSQFIILYILLKEWLRKMTFPSNKLVVYEMLNLIKKSCSQWYSVIVQFCDLCPDIQMFIFALKSGNHDNFEPIFISFLLENMHSIFSMDKQVWYLKVYTKPKHFPVFLAISCLLLVPLEHHW